LRHRQYDHDVHEYNDRRNSGKTAYLIAPADRSTRSRQLGTNPPPDDSSSRQYGDAPRQCPDDGERNRMQSQTDGRKTNIEGRVLD
jgi:hypothetical protein